MSTRSSVERVQFVVLPVMAIVTALQITLWLTGSRDEPLQPTGFAVLTVGWALLLTMRTHRLEAAASTRDLIVLGALTAITVVLSVIAVVTGNWIEQGLGVLFIAAVGCGVFGVLVSLRGARAREAAARASGEKRPI